MATGDSPDPAQFSLRCKILLRDDNAFAAWFAAYNSPCEKCSRAGKGCAKALGQPGCTGCIASKVRCSLQDTYLFEKTRDEFDGKRYEFDALRSARKTRRRTTGETRRRTAAREPSSALAARSSSVSSTSNLPPPPVFQTQYPTMPSFDETGDSLSSQSFSTLLHPHAFSPQTVSMPSFAANSVHGLDLPAQFTNQNIDPALLAPLADLMNTRSNDRETTPTSAPLHMIHQAVQTDDLVNDAVPPSAGAVELPDVPLDTLDAEDLCNLVRSLSARVAFLEDLHYSDRPLHTLSCEEIPAELVSQCINAIYDGHFEMLVAFSATNHRLRASTTVPPDVLEQLNHLSMQCHNALSRMLARLDEGRRSAPDVFVSAISNTLL